jgi:hypothetical protein
MWAFRDTTWHSGRPFNHLGILGFVVSCFLLPIATPSAFTDALFARPFKWPFKKLKGPLKGHLRMQFWGTSIMAIWLTGTGSWLHSGPLGPKPALRAALRAASILFSSSWAQVRYLHDDVFFASGPHLDVLLGSRLLDSGPKMLFPGSRVGDPQSRILNPGSRIHTSKPANHNSDRSIHRNTCICLTMWPFRDKPWHSGRSF